MKEKICIIGAWHQGTVAAACLSGLGYDVIAVCEDKFVQTLNSGKSPIFEPNLDEKLRNSIQSRQSQEVRIFQMVR